MLFRWNILLNKYWQIEWIVVHLIVHLYHNFNFFLFFCKKEILSMLLIIMVFSYFIFNNKYNIEGSINLRRLTLHSLLLSLRFSFVSLFFFSIFFPDRPKFGLIYILQMRNQEIALNRIPWSNCCLLFLLEYPTWNRSYVRFLLILFEKNIYWLILSISEQLLKRFSWFSTTFFLWIEMLFCFFFISTRIIIFTHQFLSWINKIWLLSFIFNIKRKLFKVSIYLYNINI